jgi:hypothetical protein
MLVDHKDFVTSELLMVMQFKLAFKLADLQGFLWYKKQVAKYLQ